MPVRLRIQQHAVSVFTDEPGHEPDHEFKYEQRVDEDLVVLSHLHDCLTDGGRLAERRHTLHGKPADSWLETFGKRLWRRFPEGLRELLGPLSNGERKRLLLSLDIDANTDLGRFVHQIPWDLAFYPGTRPQPLGISDRFALSRLVKVEPYTDVRLQIREKLRVLTVRATHNPVAGAQEFISKLKKQSAIDHHEWDPATVRQSLNSPGLCKKHPDLDTFHVIQFFAHGKEANGWKLDLAENVLLSPTDLKVFTAGRCQVVYLAACSSGEAAREILSGGPLAVVAMLYHVSTDTLGTFSEKLYEHLVNEQQPLDVAVQRARHTLFQTHKADCASPQLYVRDKEPVELKLDPAADRPNSERPTSAVTERPTDTDDRVDAPAPQMPSPPIAPPPTTATLRQKWVKRG